MKNRYRVEIYDENKANDLTIYSDFGIDFEHLSEIVFSNLRKFQGNVKAFVYDNVRKKKTAAMQLPMETVQLVKDIAANKK